MDEELLSEENSKEKLSLQNEEKQPRRERNTRKKEEAVTEHIDLYSDGKMRWRYDLKLLRTPLIYCLVWRILFVIVSIGFLVAFLVDVGKEDFFWKGFLEWLKFYGYFAAGVTVLTALGYLVYAAMMGGTYSVIFEMDENGINHKQTAEGAKKARKMGKATSIVGAASGSVTATGIGINSTRTEIYTSFAKVKHVVGRKWLHVIKLNAPFNHNQIYVCDEDFDFVKNYVLEHCPKKEKKIGEEK